MRAWYFVDDKQDESAAFADQFAQAKGSLTVTPILPGDFRSQVLSGRIVPEGVLLDVDLSSVPGEHGSGPGIAQDIRVKQRAGLAAFPVVRFAWREKVDANVGHDTTSSDLFDLKIQKEDLREGVEEITSLLRGVRDIYDAVLAFDRFEPDALARFVGLDNVGDPSWTGDLVGIRLDAERQVAPHSAALLFIRSVISHTGVLIDDRLLAVRLGVCPEASKDWLRLQESLSAIRYRGPGHQHFSRWWARGLEDWWFAELDNVEGLASMTIADRISALQHHYPELVPLEMPKGSAGTRPWAFCQLSAEETPPRFVPVDPEYSVRLVRRGDTPLWVDPTYASLGEALGSPDRRLNAEDLLRLKTFRHS